MEKANTDAVVEVETETPVVVDGAADRVANAVVVEVDAAALVVVLPVVVGAPDVDEDVLMAVVEVVGPAVVVVVSGKPVVIAKSPMAGDSQALDTASTINSLRSFRRASERLKSAFVFDPSPKQAQ